MNPSSNRLDSTPHGPARARTVLVVDADAQRGANAGISLARHGYRVLLAQSEGEVRLRMATAPAHVVVLGPFDALARQGVIDSAREQDPLVRVVIQLCPGEAAPAPAVVEMLALHGWVEAGSDDRALVAIVAAAMSAHERLEHLQLAERLQAELLANVSHEFRTPLAIIIGYLDLMRDGTFGGCSTEVQGTLERVKGNASYLLELVEEFLDYSRRDPAGAPQTAIPLSPVLQEIAESFALLMRDKPVQFHAHIPDGLPAVAGEAAKLRVIVQNLLTNAAKFTAAGHIVLTAATDDAERIVIMVEDTGPGIPPEACESIFDLFRQLQPHDMRRRGIGLGLALARRFARLFGGDITVDSTVGMGTTFAVTLPVARVRSRAA